MPVPLLGQHGYCQQNRGKCATTLYMIKRGYFLYLLLAKSTWPRRFVGYASMELSTLIRQDGRKSRKLYAVPNKQTKPDKTCADVLALFISSEQNIIQLY